VAGIVIYLDSVFVIYYVEDFDERGAVVRRCLAHAAKEQEFAVSPLVSAESLIKPFREANLQAERDIRWALSQFTMLSLRDEHVEQAARLRSVLGLHLIDALHMAIAQVAGCTALWTADAAFARAGGDFVVDVVARELGREGP
jgi:predicted nucleic acid-binding protein